ncbi:Bug family tripartite tricarboxylate transporter substrate binding protein [Paracraurococcus lichenis]|uniref:Tripartite tricarboxylate transporter substrate binding protein n=1 Tax=Paracraurococcus lichenis TaxID=3064888 RepID=A0ABT9DTA7_9PROT|nr:tripartite tricarboxylate transporter substrate binding protein [Paracraurococcus sp. LOR1-02]MDO9707137.1 tripartite tricarboxylate transporter substrate binding protein [Paracraurococcus sp. LOR1-02]
MPAWTRRAALAGAGLLATRIAAAEPAFDRPLRLVLPFAPGGSTDISGRLLAEQMRQSLGQPVVVENRPGANGLLALEAVARSRPDGTTLMLGNVTTNGTAPLLAGPRLGFDYERDMQAVTRIADVPSLLVATAANFVPQSLAEVVALARERPGRLNYFSTGVGSYTHLDTVLLARAAGIDVVHVVLSGGAGPSLQTVIAGDVQFGFMNAATATPMVRDGRLKALAVTGERRLAEWPAVPTMAEAGYPGIGTSAWHVLMLPSGVPEPAQQAVFAAARAALGSEPVLAAFRRQSIQPTPSASIAEARDWMRAELAAWRRILRQTAIATAD